MKKFTFKTEKSKGRYASFFPDHHLIKLDKKQVGNITDSYPHRIKFMVKSENKCGWKWITLKAKFKSILEAKEMLNRMHIQIQEKYELHQLED